MAMQKAVIIICSADKRWRRRGKKKRRQTEWTAFGWEYKKGK